MNGPFVDLQVNGFRGVSFSDPRLTLAGIETVSTELARRGVGGYCPTIITSPHEVYRRNLPLLAAAAEHQPAGARILGIHLEGPFISPDWGARGIHPAQHVVPPSIDLLSRFQEWAQGRVVLVTIAPDQPGAIDLVAHAVTELGIVVSLGHHLASGSVISEAVSAGATAVTHLGNGLPELIHRHQNPLWPALVDDRLYAMIIADGFHLPRELIDLVLRVKPPDRIAITSDLMHFGGLQPGLFNLGNVPVRLEADGRLHREDSDQLAGAARTIDMCANHLRQTHGLSESRLRALTFDNPLALIGTSL